MSLLSAGGIGNYATSAAAIQRSDLAFKYEYLSTVVAQYAKSGPEIMIKNNWLEQPPGIVGKENLAKNKNG
ncbi:hypothetical protein BIV60_21630 [Bacillus sp. MUM 116]|nr:hypothetical protein BIV60_21630 [Bacillus sp. MUM 116]